MSPLRFYWFRAIFSLADLFVLRFQSVHNEFSLADGLWPPVTMDLNGRFNKFKDPIIRLRTCVRNSFVLWYVPIVFRNQLMFVGFVWICSYWVGSGRKYFYYSGIIPFGYENKS